MTKTRDNHFVPQWYQRGFIEPGRSKLALLDMKPTVHRDGNGRAVAGRSLFESPTARCFHKLDLYTTVFGFEVNDEIERRLFGEIDRKGKLMVARIAAANLTNVEAKVMDGQALPLDDGSFDAVFSIFGVIMFSDWRKGLSEMARVTRPGGYGVVATWQDRGAATFLLLGQIRRKLFPERAGMTMPMAVQALSDPADFARELITAGFRDPHIEHVTHEYLLETAALAEPDTLFGMSPDWASLSEAEKAAVVAEVWTFAADRAVLPIPSTALIATA